MRHLLTLTLLAFTLCSAARAGETPAESLTSAQQSYDQATALQRTDATAAREKFATAEKGFQQLVDAGAVNGPLLYNLGNAQLQQGKIGAAIANYLRAQRLMPGDARLQANLAHARSQVKDRMDIGSGLLYEDVAGWWHLLTQPSRWWLGGVLWLAAWSLVLARLVTPTLPIARGFSPAAIWAFGLAGAVLLATVAADALAPALRPQGVTLVDGVEVRKGNGEGFQKAFEQPLSQGVEFRVTDERPGWLQIRLPDGKGGWIRSVQAGTA